MSSTSQLTERNSVTERERALEFLLSRIDYERITPQVYGEREFRLDRMRELLARVGNPQAELPIVHVAGTKGKGSTSALIAAMLTAAGYRTGLYSSPHLDTVEERLVIDGRPCSAEVLTELLDHVRPVVAEMDLQLAADGAARGPTYFEILTCLALLYFRRQEVDVAVLEVGMGGRLDSTNVCQPKVAVITSISYDHMKQLGNTLTLIAREKAGIIKPGVPVVSGVVDDEPRVAIEEVARERGVRLLQLGLDFDFAYRPPQHLELGDALGMADFRIHTAAGEWRMQDVPLRLVGRHQAANAAVALAAVGELAAQGWPVSEESLRVGLASVQWPARMEVASRRPTVVLDGAHNVASIEVLLTAIEESFTARRRVLVFATTREKDELGMLRLLAPKFDHIILTRYLNNPRGVPPEELAEVVAGCGGKSTSVAADPAAAWQEARSLAAAEDLIVVTGSFFLAAEVRQQIRLQATDHRLLDENQQAH